MALPPLASTDLLTPWLEDGEALDEPRAALALRMASTLVRRETGKDWTDPENPAVLVAIPDAVEEVVGRVAWRLYSNPDALTGERVDDAQVFRKADETGFGLPDTERYLLAPYAAGRELGGLSTVATTRGESTLPDLRDEWFEEESLFGLPPFGEPRW